MSLFFLVSSQKGAVSLATDQPVVYKEKQAIKKKPISKPPSFFGRLCHLIYHNNQRLVGSRIPRLDNAPIQFGSF
jgi:hypothetical protein